MPTVQENLKLWSEHPWPQDGAEWTVGYGGADLAWQAAILPRLAAFLPAKHILEIGPGFGLWTSYLRRQCRRMTLVDLAPRCIDACRTKFGKWRMQYIVNDGKSLEPVADASVDLAFSWHSLVHAERDVMRAYARQLARKLRGGVGLLQHSNFGSVVDPVTGQASRGNEPGFGADVTADRFASDCIESGLQVVYQELVPWDGGELISCFTLLRRPLPGEAITGGQPPRFENPGFWEHVRDYGRVVEAYRYPSKGLAACSWS